MVVLPFIYFTLLLIFIYKRRGFNIGAYVVSIYSLTSFFALLMEISSLRPYVLKNYEIGVVPTVLYCFLLTLTIWPFYNFRGERILTIGLNKPKSFNKIVYFYFGCFLLIVVSAAGNIVQILKGDLGALRIAKSRGEAISEDVATGGPFHSVMVLANSFGGFSIIMLLFYFYSICFLNKSKLFNTIILLSSMSIIIIGILGVDRSKSIYWLISYGLMLVIFWSHMTKRQHRKIFKITGIILGLIGSYFLMVTFSRFGEGENGSQDSIISYAGQSYIYFCYFFDNVDYGQFSLQRIFPWFYNLFIDNGINSTVELNSAILGKTGTYVGVFSTFIGDIMVASGKLAAIIYCFCLFIFSKKILHFKNKVYYQFYEMLFLFCLISIPMLGLFTHFYASHSRTIPFLFFIFYAFYLRLNLVVR
ncbi:oligosaccharide repeat unit polymerase [Mesonia ostreae]|uniref:Oligosaccharide repeat unit polymerase n=1 Tax=Mesonia ostreae TaxID=861110 RepID=A0ABU2KH71_9FLAO|nr:oligosaccharide repeat unit polymerase [Mesonia ostreae]MDT0294045.1 oligosaccharide repeat unit polymerase [Mesonia ostreae]